MREASGSRHFGHIIKTYRHHPFHGRRPLPQEVVARWLGITQVHLSRIENGPAIKDLDRLISWARILSVPADLLWFTFPNETFVPHGAGTDSNDASANAASRVADSNLIVIKAILQGWQLGTVLRRQYQDLIHINLPWSDSLIYDVANRTIDAAIYNEQRTRRLLRERPELQQSVTIVGRFGHSMGGRNFYILASRSRGYKLSTGRELLAAPQDLQIALPRESDMYDNLLTVFGLTEEQLKYKGIEIIDIPHYIGLEVFDLNRNVLAIGGQNLRIHARLAEDYVEVLNSSMLDHARQRSLAASASNVMIANSNWLRQLNIKREELYGELMRNFLVSWADQDHYRQYIEELILTASLPHGVEAPLRERMVRHVLYETYRFGEPIDDNFGRRER